MIGREYASEKRFYRDELTGREVCRLTGTSNNYHLYFTDNSFTLGDREIYFLSDRGSPRPGIYNIFRMDLETGAMVQITDEASGVEGHTTKTPESDIVIYRTGNQLKKLMTRDGRTEVIYEENGFFQLGAPFISPDKKNVAVIRNERVNIKRGENYKGFKEMMYAVKLGYITLISLASGAATDVFTDTHQLGHLQYAPDDSEIIMFCHEGPWNLVHQRIWLMNLRSREVFPCFRQGEDDCVGHEFWTRDGLIFFDNRQAGHDGTITSDKTQATIQPVTGGDAPYVGLADKTGNVLRTIEMPYYCNHYHAGETNTLLVGDAVEDLVLIDLSEAKAKCETLCTHHTSWRTSIAHAHPTFSWNSDRILYTSDRDGHLNLYSLRL